MRKRIIYEPTLSDAALLILKSLRGAFLESFWPHPYYHTFCQHRKKESFRVAVERLKKRGLIIAGIEKGRAMFALSPEGEKFASRLKLKLELAKARRWDGRWRLLIFDIPEKTRGKRDFFRRELNNFGFYPLQKSVWAYPHQLPEDFFELWEELDFRNEVILVEAAKIKGDDELRRFFSL